jgi:RecA/RadA recombinase
MSKILEQLVAATENEYGTIVGQDGCRCGDITELYDTGSYALNAIISGSIFGGAAAGRSLALAGKSGCGKTYAAMSISDAFLKSHENAAVIYFDTEAAVSTDMFIERGMDVDRISVIPVNVLQDFKTQVMRVIKEYSKVALDSKGKLKDDRMRLMIVLDSLGMLATRKEMDDGLSGSDKKDMTRAGIIRGVFRTIVNDIGALGIPLIITNHTYAVIGAMHSADEVAGGGGLKYAASTIVTFGKRQEKDGTELIGTILPAKAIKSRLTKEGSTTTLAINFEKGMDRYYGLCDMAINSGVWQRVSKKIKVGEKMFWEKEIVNDPEKFFTDDVLEAIDEYAKQRYKYGENPLIDGEGYED